MAFQDEHTGMGGSYVIQDGKRVLQHRTATTGHGADAEPATEPAGSIKPASATTRKPKD